MWAYEQAIIRNSHQSFSGPFPGPGQRFSLACCVPHIPPINNHRGFTTAGKSLINSGGNMFEHEEDIVNNLLQENADFKRMYDKVCQIRVQVKSANTGENPMDDYSLENLKKEKLYLKDRMAGMINEYRREHA
jgi:hypothetical protein